MIIESGGTLSSFNDNIWGSSSSTISALTVLFLASNITSITLSGNYPTLTIFTDGNISALPYTDTAVSSKVKAIIHNTYSLPWTPVYIVQAVISGSLSSQITQNSSLQTIYGQLSISNYNSGGSGFTVQTNTSNTYGSFSIDASGNWTYTMSSPWRQLNNNQSVTDTFSVSGYDGSSTAPSSNITITIVGTRDVPTITTTTGYTTYNLTYLPSSNAVTYTVGGTSYTTSSQLTGKVSINTIDTGDTTVFNAQYNNTSTYGTFSIDTTGNWTYDLSMNAIKALNAGVTGQDMFTIRTSASDVSQAMTFNIVGANTPATITGSSSLSVGYNSSLYTSSFGVSSTYSVTDPNTGEASFIPVLSPTSSNSGYGTYTLTSDGIFNYTLVSIGSATVSATYSDSVIIYSVDYTSHTINITIDPLQLYSYPNTSTALINAGFTLEYFINKINSGNIPVSSVSTLLTAGFTSQNIINLMNHPTTAATIAIAITNPIITDINLLTNIKLGSQFTNGNFKIQSKRLKIRGSGKLTA